MTNAIFHVPVPDNEPVLSHAPGSPERKALYEMVAKMRGEKIDIPLVINGKEVRTNDLGECRIPHDHNHVLATYHKATGKEVTAAIEAGLAAQDEWANTPWEQRAAIFLKMAELLSTSWRPVLNGSTMLAQSKNSFQAEIDAVCELADFLRFNVDYMRTMYAEQPPMNPKGIWNRLEYRPLEGFIYAITPFNFTSIAANLPLAPVLMGNVALWKPSHHQVFSAWYLMELFKEAGLPDGVINFIPGYSAEITEVALKHPSLAGIHYTGSTAIFRSIWRQVGDQIDLYKSYPRLVGETGGKDFIFAHPTADRQAVATAMVRGSFEFQGQKCSASSRAYIPASMWEYVKEAMGKQLATIKMGSPEDPTNYVNAVIHRGSFDKCVQYIDHAKNSDQAEIVFGGNSDDSVGYFVEPTVVLAKDPKYKSMIEEIFGPILTVYVYEDNKLDETLELCDSSSEYALTGAIFSQDRYALIKMSDALRHAAGNFYMNDKPTGAVVGQQPFGGARGSGTNDKAGSPINLMRWVSPRTIKECFAPPTEYMYPAFEADK